MGHEDVPSFQAKDSYAVLNNGLKKIISPILRTPDQTGRALSVVFISIERTLVTIGKR